MQTNNIRIVSSESITIDHQIVIRSRRNHRGKSGKIGNEKLPSSSEMEALKKMTYRVFPNRAPGGCIRFGDFGDLICGPKGGTIRKMRTKHRLQRDGGTIGRGGGLYTEKPPAQAHFRQKELLTLWSTARARSRLVNGKCHMTFLIILDVAIPKKLQRCFYRNSGFLSVSRLLKILIF